MSVTPPGLVTPAAPPAPVIPAATAPPANPLLAGTPPAPVAGVTLTQFGQATPEQRAEYLALAATPLATTARGETVRGVRLADPGGPAHTIILSARGDAAVDVTALTRAPFDRLDTPTREMALALGAFPGAALGFPLTANDLRRLTPAERLAHVAALAGPPGAGGERALVVPDTLGTATFLLAPSGGLIDVGQLRFGTYHELAEADRKAARDTGALDLRATAAEMRRAAPAIAQRHVAELGTTLGTSLGATASAVRGVVLPGPAPFIASADGARVIDVAGLTFPAYHALSLADVARVKAVGGIEPVPTPAELRAATPAIRLAYVVANAVTIDTVPGGTPLRGLPPRSAAWADPFVLSADGGEVIDVARLTDAGIAALSAGDRAILAAAGGARTPPPYLLRDPAQRIADAQLVHPARAPANNPLMATSATASGTEAFRDLFLAAHSEHQLEWLVARNGDGGVALGPAGGQVNVLLSVDGTRVINVDALTIGDVSRLPFEDQARLSAKPSGTYTVPGFGALLVRLGMTTDRAEMTGNLAAARRIIEGKDVQPGSATLRTVLPAEDQQLFLDQIATIETRLATTAIFSAQALSTALAAIDKRHRRMSEFHKALENTNAGAAGLNLVTLRQGYDDFRREERRIRNIDQRIAQMTRLAGIGVPSLDLPALIVELQSLYEVKAKAIADADTAELEQQNALLRDYAAMQGLVNETSNSFKTPADQKNPERLPLRTTTNERLVAFFDKRSRVPHPIEVLTSASRPTIAVERLEFRVPFRGGTTKRDNHDTGANRDKDGTNNAVNGAFVEFLINDVGMTYDQILPPALRRGGRYRNPDGTMRDLRNEKGPIWRDEKEKDGGDRAAARRELNYVGSKIEGFLAKLDDHFRGAFGDNDSAYLAGGADRYVAQIWLDYLFDQSGDLGSYNQNHYRLDPPDFQGAYGMSLEEVWLKSDDGDGFFSALPALRKDQWDGFGTRLAEVVTTINQSNQLRQNAISQASRQANRHFDVVSNTLKRMFDLNQAIGRNVA